MKIKQDSRLKTQDSRRGFTLIELIIAFTILGLILLIIGGSLRLSIRALERGDKIIEETERMRGIYERISSDIRSAYPYPIMKEGERRIAFEGKSDSLSLVTSQVDINWPGGFKWVSYSVKDGDLILVEKVVPNKGLDESKGKETLLEHKVKEIRFEFYEKGKERWETSWDSKERGKLPEIVKVSLTLESERPSFPPFLISLPVGYNPEEGR